MYRVLIVKSSERIPFSDKAPFELDGLNKNEADLTEQRIKSITKGKIEVQREKFFNKTGKFYLVMDLKDLKDLKIYAELRSMTPKNWDERLCFILKHKTEDPED